VGRILPDATQALRLSRLNELAEAVKAFEWHHITLEMLDAFRYMESEMLEGLLITG
jgi:hypothetical protein